MTDGILGHDLRLEAGLAGVGLATERGDLDVATGGDNLAQALLIRFNTPVGELTDLGHPDYGSRLHELIGRPNDATTRNLARLFTLETLRQESRVGEVHHLSVETVDAQPDRLLVSIKLSPTTAQQPLNLVFSVNLEGTT